MKWGLIAFRVLRAWYLRKIFTVLASSLMLRSEYQRSVSTFVIKLQLLATPSTSLVPQLRVHFQSCSSEIFHWCLPLYVTTCSWYLQVLTILLLQECICWYTLAPGIQHLSCAYGWFTTWVWAGYFQISIQAPFTFTSCNIWDQLGGHSWCMVCLCTRVLKSSPVRFFCLFWKWTGLDCFGKPGNGSWTA